MSPVALQLVHTVFINTINIVSTFWSGIKQNKKNNTKSTKTAGWTLHSAIYEQLGFCCPYLVDVWSRSVKLKGTLSFSWPRSAFLNRCMSIQEECSRVPAMQIR